MQVLQSFLWVSPIHDTFSVAHVFCVKFLGKNYVLGAFCKADIYAKSKGEQLSTFSEKMHINDLTFGQFFLQRKSIIVIWVMKKKIFITLLVIARVTSNISLPYPTLLGFDKALLVIAWSCCCRLASQRLSKNSNFKQAH